MTRFLAIALLASLLGLAAAGTPGSTQGGQAVGLSESGGPSGDSMAGSGCSACAAMGACIATGPAQSAGIEIFRLPFVQPSCELSDQLRAPDTAPPKRSSI